MSEFITIAILCKDKPHLLDLYLECIENQTWPKNKTFLYIRTNNNNDNSAEILKKWVEKVKDLYPIIKFDDSDVQENVQQYAPHEWNSLRFKVLGQIRQDSINFAIENKSHYFVADCDNFIRKFTVEKMMNSGLQIIAPMLKTPDNSFYSNYHSSIDANGYFLSDDLYYKIFNYTIKGRVQLPVVHCTYFIRNDSLTKIQYLDDTFRHEYVIFSHNARKAGIPQYIDNTENYGVLTFCDDETFSKVKDTVLSILKD